VQHLEQPSFQLGLFKPGPPIHDAATAQTLSEVVAKGAMPLLVLVVSNCPAAYERMRACGVEFTQEPVDRYGAVDAGFRDPSGNGWKLIEAKPKKGTQATLDEVLKHEAGACRRARRRLTSRRFKITGEPCGFRLRF
jgi:hypothetical protein